VYFINIDMLQKRIYKKIASNGLILMKDLYYNIYIIFLNVPNVDISEIIRTI